MRNSTTATHLAEAGVDVLIGYHPHTVIPPRWFDVQLEDGTAHRMLCLCATGNFLSDQRDRYTCNGIVFEFTIEETSAGVFEITDPVYIPTYVWRYEAEDGEGYEYRVLAVGEWLDEPPRGHERRGIQPPADRVERRAGDHVAGQRQRHAVGELMI